MSSPHDVVITGLGLVTPIGIGRDAFWSALVAGQSGIERLPEFAGTELPFRFGARIKGFDAKQYVQPRKTIKVMCGEIQAGYSAAMLAMQDAGLAKGAVEPDRLGVVLGSEMLFGEVEEVASVYRRCAENGQFKFSHWGGFVFKDLYPLWMLKYLPNMAACQVFAKSAGADSGCGQRPMSASHWLVVRGVTPSSFWAEVSGAIERPGMALIAW